LTLKKLIPVRLIRNGFFERVQELENRGAPVEELQQLLGKARAKAGMFEGNIEEGELEIGQVSAMINDIRPAKAILEEIVKEFNEAAAELCKFRL
jgi:enoyl-[acyl-carrier protein] reductase II